MSSLDSLNCVIYTVYSIITKKILQIQQNSFKFLHVYFRFAMILNFDCAKTVLNWNAELVNPRWATLVSSPKSEDKMESGLLLDVVVGESPSVLELLSSEDQPLLVWGNAFLVLL